MSNSDSHPSGVRTAAGWGSVDAALPPHPDEMPLYILIAAHDELVAVLVRVWIAYG
jgi:hypothetical protein